MSAGRDARRPARRPVSRYEIRWIGQVDRCMASDGAAARAAAAADEVVAPDQDDRADDRDHDRHDIDAGRVVLATGEEAGDEPADEPADDAEGNVSYDAEALVTLDQEAREIASDRSDDEPGHDSH